MKSSLALVMPVIAGLALAACSDEPWQPGGQPSSGGQPAQTGTGTQSGSGSGEPGTPGGQPDTPRSGEPANSVNLPPQIRGFEVESAVVAVGGTTTLQLAVVDVENDPFHVWWRASCGAVAQDSEEPGKATFIAPTEPGECRVTALIQDADMHTTGEHTSRILVTPAGETEVDDVQ